MNQHHDEIAQAAQRFYGLHGGEHLSIDRRRLVDRCTTHLMQTFSLSTRMAQDIARRAEPGPGSPPPPYR